MGSMPRLHARGQIHTLTNSVNRLHLLNRAGTLDSTVRITAPVLLENASDKIRNIEDRRKFMRITSDIFFRAMRIAERQISV